MKWVVALLALANVALYIWTGAPADEDGGRAPHAQPEVNREAMLLLGEPEAAAPAVAEIPAEITPLEPETPPAGAFCYRIGPFKGEDGWAAANAWMQSRQFAYRAVRSESREMRAVRVYLGPFESRAAAQPVLDWLDARAIEHFTDAATAGEVRVSLGYFTQEALAVKYVAHLLSRGAEARTRTEYRAIGPFDWMEASVDAAGRDLLLARGWREKGVAVLAIDCGAMPAAGG